MLLCPQIMYDLTSNPVQRSGKLETKYLSYGTAFDVHDCGGGDEMMMMINVGPNFAWPSCYFRLGM
jgi:hypothetical protein